MSEINNIELWKMKKLIKMLSNARGNGTSMITLSLPPGESIPKVNNMLTNEFGTATNIKSRVNKLSVLSAITSTQQKLKQYKSLPKNGLIIYCGTMVISGNKEKKVTYDITPFKPINKFIYTCDSKFHTEILESILTSDEKYGFIIIDGNGTLYGTVCGNNQSVLHKFTVELPKKHRRGGQSSLRFARLRMEARDNYVKKVGELATHYFITNELPNVKGIILAGNADFKTELSNSNHFDFRLKKVIIQLVDISYGGLSGFHQAIELSADILDNVKLIEEKKLLNQYFNEMTLDSGKYCFGIKQTMMALDMGAAERLIVWEDFSLERYVLKDTNNNKIIKYLKENESINDLNIESTFEVEENELWAEWISEHYTDYGTQLDFVTDRSSEGTQFVQGFGGIGCILRWKAIFEDDFDTIDDNSIDYLDGCNNSDSDFDDFF